SKSLGNFFTIREVLEKFDPEVVRFFILRAHYRSPLNYSDAALEEARAGLLRLYTALEKAGLEHELSEGPAQALMQAAMAASHDQVAAFRQAMDDDFNTPEAIAALFGLANEVNRLVAAGEGEQAMALGQTLRGLALCLGLLARSASVAKRAGGQGQTGGSGGLDEGQIEALIAERIQAKKSKDFARADGIRAELLAQGIVLEDGPAGTTWRRA
ncbi:MAG: DALR domain-containing protein, partial [Burkholderiaceae bacterium]